MIGSSIVRNIRRLLVFTGRDAPRHFWPWAILLVLMSVAAGVVVMVPTMAATLRRMQQFAAQHPDQATVTSAPGRYEIHIDGAHPELMPDMTPFLVVTFASGLIAVLLLAASVARRLHDRNRSGWWGVAPVPFLLIGMVVAPRVLTGFDRAGPDLSLFGVMFVSNLIYLGMLITLVVQLVQAGTPGPNRFGPPAV